MARVVLEHVRKVYPGNVAALSDVSVDIEDGQYTVLVGPSGCGKTTALRLVAGLEVADAGVIRIGDRVVNDVAPKKRDVAMVFQNYALYPHMTVRKNLAFALKLRRVPRREIDRRVEETARMLGIESLLKRRPRQLSGGQRQRVALGRAIVREPKAFLFDEPLSNLDAKLRISTRAELKRLHRRLGTTTIHVTHDQEEAMSLGERIVVMSEGKVQQVGRPMEVFTNPANQFVAAFIGTPPMNLIKGFLQRTNGSLSFVEKPVSTREPMRVTMPAHLASVLDGQSERVALGIRAQALSVGATSDVELDVDVVEPLGDQTDVIGRTHGGQRLVARCPSRADLTANPLGLGIDWSHVHVFDGHDEGERLTPAV